MKKLIINKKIILDSFASAQTKWINSPSIELIIDLKQKDLDLVIEVLLNKLPNDFACCILADLVEKDNFPTKFLNDVQSKGNKSCKVALCLSDNLPLDIIKLCEKSKDIDVYEHYMQKKNAELIKMKNIDFIK